MLAKSESGTMARQKKSNTPTTEVDHIEQPEPDNPKQTKIHVVETRRYTEVQSPDDGEFDDNDPEEEVIEAEPVDPLEAWLKQITSERQLVMHVYALPSFHKNGRMGVKALDRPFITSFPFSQEDIDVYQSRIQASYPQGGVLEIELREHGLVIKRWQETLAPIVMSTTQNQNGIPQYPQPVVINTHATDGTTPQIDPFELMSKQAESFQRIIASVQAILPQPQPAQQQLQPVASDPEVMQLKMRVDVMDRLLGFAEKNESVATRLIKSIFPEKEEATTGKSMADVLVAFLEHGPQIVSAVLPILMTMNQANTRPVAPGPIQQLPAATNGSHTEPKPQPQQADPATRAWQRTIQRLVEDCWENASVYAGADTVLDMVERYNQFGPFVEQLLTASPEQVLDLLTAMMPGAAKIKELPHAVEWVTALQAEIQNQLEPQQEGQSNEVSDIEEN